MSSEDTQHSKVCLIFHPVWGRERFSKQLHTLQSRDQIQLTTHDNDLMQDHNPHNKARFARVSTTSQEGMLQSLSHAIIIKFFLMPDRKFLYMLAGEYFLVPGRFSADALCSYMRATNRRLDTSMDHRHTFGSNYDIPTHTQI